MFFAENLDKKATDLSVRKTREWPKGVLFAIADTSCSARRRPACHSEQIPFMEPILLKGEESLGHKFDVVW